MPSSAPRAIHVVPHGLIIVACCAWCGDEIEPTDDTRDIGGRRVHDTPTRRCTDECDRTMDAYAADYAATHADAGW